MTIDWIDAEELAAKVCKLGDEYDIVKLSSRHCLRCTKSALISFTN